jgi:hypothetical protein
MSRSPHPIPASPLRRLSLAALTAAAAAACQDPEAPTGGSDAAIAQLQSAGCVPDFHPFAIAGAGETVGIGISDQGQVTGRFDDEAGVTHGYVRDRRGQFRYVDFPGGVLTAVTGLSNAGVLGGIYLDAAGHFHGFVESGGHFESIDYPGAVDSRIRSIGRTGELVGNFGDYAEGIEHGFIKDGSGFHQVDYPGSLGSDVHGGNGHGQYVGDFAGEDDKVQAFVLSHGRFTAFAVPGPYTGTSARGITPSGVIVGLVEDSVTFNLRGFVKIGERITFIDYPGASSTSVNRINARGEIVGTFIAADGVPRGFTLSGCGVAHGRGARLSDRPRGGGSPAGSARSRAGPPARDPT